MRISVKVPLSTDTELPIETVGRAHFLDVLQNVLDHMYKYLIKMQAKNLSRTKMVEAKLQKVNNLA